MEFKDQINNECGFHVSGDICIDGETLRKLERLVIDEEPVTGIISTNSDGEPTYHTEPATSPPEMIVNKLKRKYNCDSELCVLGRREIETILTPAEIRSIMHNRFKPVGPRDTTDWLSNEDIDSVLHQIHNKYMDTDNQFFHIPFQMRDFAKTRTELATLNFPQEYRKKYRTFGTVVNTDYSDGKGIHWFALFGDFRTKPYTIEYFNSSGESPLDEILMWMNDAAADWTQELKTPVKTVIASTLVHQRDNHSCGPYSLYYIISRLEGVPSSEFGRVRIKDNTMHLFRKYLFRKK